MECAEHRCTQKRAFDAKRAGTDDTRARKRAEYYRRKARRGDGTGGADGADGSDAAPAGAAEAARCAIL